MRGCTWWVLGLLAGCELLGPEPHDTGPKYVTVQPNQGNSSSHGSSSGGTQAQSQQQSTSIPNNTSNGPACPEWCATARGYHCEFGECLLNGNTGPLQVTLTWPNNPRAREDLDLHVIDPTGCEIYYGSRNCGSGSLDLDQNASCGNTDNAMGVGNDTENVIYTAGVEPTHGQYSVWVVDWEDQCDGNTPNPFSYTVTIRYHGQTHTFSGNFYQGSGVQGGPVTALPASSGRVLINTFTY